MVRDRPRLPLNLSDGFMCMDGDCSLSMWLLLGDIQEERELVSSSATRRASSIDDDEDD